MNVSVYDDRRADDREHAEEVRRRKYVVYRRFNELTVEQANFVNRRYPPHTDPWQYEYELLGDRIIDRYMLTRMQ